MPSGHGPIEVHWYCMFPAVSARPPCPPGMAPLKCRGNKSGCAFLECPPCPPGMAPLKCIVDNTKAAIVKSPPCPPGMAPLKSDRFLVHWF